MLHKIMSLIGGGFLILIGGFFLFVTIKAMVGKPEADRALQEAPFITDGKLDPENEGKNVIYMISTDNLGGTVDDEYGLSFDYPIIHREVEVLKDDGAGHIGWKRVYDSDDLLCDNAFFGDVSGDVEVQSRLLASLAGTNNILGASDFKKDELEDFCKRNSTFHTEEYKSVLYITDTDTKYFQDIKRDDVSDRIYKDYKDEVGSYRICYRGTKADGDIDSIVVIGRQVGNSIIYDEEDHIDTLTCYENVHNTEELLEKDGKLFSLGISIFGFGASLAMIIGGIIIVIKGFKKD